MPSRGVGCSTRWLWASLASLALPAVSQPATAQDTGDERWRFGTDALVESSPTIIDGTVYIGSDDENVYALAADVIAALEERNLRYVMPISRNNRIKRKCNRFNRLKQGRAEVENDQELYV